MDKIAITLNRDELTALNYALGLAMGQALKGNDKELFWSILRLANRVNENSPNWTRYEMPEETKI